MLATSPLIAVQQGVAVPAGETTAAVAADVDASSAEAAAVAAYELPESGSIHTAALGDGVWLRPELDETSITVVMQNLRDWGIENVYVDVFRMGETLHRSGVFPQRRDATERDWLGLIVEQAHAHDIRVHGWLQTLCWVENGPYLVTSSSLVRQYPEWLDLNEEGRAFDGSSLARYVNPAVPEVVERLTSLTAELCGYGLDGINLDAVQYNYRADMGYHPSVVAEFHAATGIDPLAIEPDMARDSPWMQWTIFREDKLTSLVQAIGRVCDEEGARLGRRVMLSALVDPGYEQTRGANYRFQHWGFWVNEEIVDATTPGCFAGDLTGLERQLWEVRSIHMGTDDVACVPGFMLDVRPGGGVGQGTYSVGHGDAHPSLADQMRLLRNAGFQHFNIMDYHALLVEKEQPEQGQGKRRNRLWDIFSRDGGED